MTYMSNICWARYCTMSRTVISRLQFQRDFYVRDTLSRINEHLLQVECVQIRLHNDNDVNSCAYDLQAMIYPTICTHCSLHSNYGKKITAFLVCIHIKQLTSSWYTYLRDTAMENYNRKCRCVEHMYLNDTVISICNSTALNHQWAI